MEYRQLEDNDIVWEIKQKWGNNASNFRFYVKQEKNR